MTHFAHPLRLAATLITSLTLVSLAPAHAANIGMADYKAGKTKLSADYKADKAACDALTANAKDICQEEAKAKEKNGRAALEFGHTGKASDQKKLLATQVDTAYEVAKERCDDQTGNARDLCQTQAKAAHTKGQADLKMVAAVTDAGKDAAADKREADHKVAAEKCEALAGDAKSACVSAAKARFGKS